jgi:transposase
MNSVGIDLHKKTIVLCVLNQDHKVLARRTFACVQTDDIAQFFTALRPFQATVEATASYHWLVELIEPLADRVVLAHPGKLRIIAESTKKTDRLDAQVLAEMLAEGKIPEAFRPGPRQRQHRALVRHRQYLQGQITAIKNKVRRIASDYNADRRDLFTRAGQEHLAGLAMQDGDRFVLAQLLAQLRSLVSQRLELAVRLKQFAAAAPAAEAEARAVLESIPYVGPVTIDVVVSELGDVRRFGSTKKASAYAGLAPIVRQSGGQKPKELPITKAGSPLLRWALVEAAWRLVRHTARWRSIYEGIKKRRGSKKAIVAVARRLLGVMVAMLKSGQAYRLPAG